MRLKKHCYYGMDNDDCFNQMKIGMQGDKLVWGEDNEDITLEEAERALLLY